jgi:hypothetical protein
MGHHRRKWKSPILGVAQIAFRDIFWLLFFLRTWNQNFFLLTHGKILQCSPYFCLIFPLCAPIAITIVPVLPMVVALEMGSLFLFLSMSFRIFGMY